MNILKYWCKWRRGDDIMLVDGCGCNDISGGMADVHLRGTMKLKCPVDLYDLSLYQDTTLDLV
jgi:hypothetical protein